MKDSRDKSGSWRLESAVERAHSGDETKAEYFSSKMDLSWEESFNKFDASHWGNANLMAGCIGYSFLDYMWKNS